MTKNKNFLEVIVGVWSKFIYILQKDMTFHYQPIKRHKGGHMTLILCHCSIIMTLFN